MHSLQNCLCSFLFVLTLFKNAPFLFDQLGISDSHCGSLFVVPARIQHVAFHSQKITVSLLLPGTSTAAEWRDLLQSRRQFWPTLTTRHASLTPLCADALQRERRQMQSKHLWCNIDINWGELDKKLQVLAPTGLTREEIWKESFRGREVLRSGL